MRAVVQRVSQASVTVNQKMIGAIDKGFMVLLGIHSEDTPEDVEWLAAKLIGMRVFPDGDGKMNLDICEVKGGFLVVSQFTLHARYKKGNRPSFVEAARPDHAIPLYTHFVNFLREQSGCKVETGEFGATMDVHLNNDGPVTLVLDTRNKE
jgi:D-tyrosyl-tRNA(Tyr) deacylase